MLLMVVKYLNKGHIVKERMLDTGIAEKADAPMPMGNMRVKNLAIIQQLEDEMHHYQKAITEFKEHFHRVNKKYLVTRKQLTNFTYFAYENLESFRKIMSGDSKLSGHSSYWNLNDNPKLVINEDKTEYFRGINGKKCLIEGTDWSIVNQKDCVCSGKWWGPSCSYPLELQVAKLDKSQVSRLAPRPIPRHVVNCLTFNIELETLELRLAELGDVVDAFLIAESNYTAYGDPKPLYLQSVLDKGYLEKYHHKIYYFFKGSFE